MMAKAAIGPKGLTNIMNIVIVSPQNPLLLYTIHVYCYQSTVEIVVEVECCFMNHYHNNYLLTIFS